MNYSQLDILRQKLLQKDDWATVSICRPLRMAFASVEEREKVGRRRRITEDDRKRQTIPTPRVISPEFYTSKRRKLDLGGRMRMVTPKNINITINGRPPAATQLSIVGKVIHSQQSSESMLLDREENPCPLSIAKARARSREPSRTYCAEDQSSQILNSADYELDKSGYRISPHQHPGSLRYSVSDITCSQHTPSGKLIPGKSCNSDGYSYLSSSPAENVSNRNSPYMLGTTQLPVCNRFTIDEQVLAEREGKLEVSVLCGNREVPSSGHRDNNNPSSTISWSCTADDKQTRHPATDGLSFSSNQQSGRLPEIKHKVHRSLGKTQTISPTPLDNRTLKVSSEISHSSRSPAKFFGQPLPVNTAEDDRHMHVTLAPCNETYNDTTYAGQNALQVFSDPETSSETYSRFATSPLVASISRTPYNERDTSKIHTDSWVNTRDEISSGNNNHLLEENIPFSTSPTMRFSGKVWTRSSPRKDIHAVNFLSSSVDTNEISPSVQMRNEQTVSPQLLLQSDGMDPSFCSMHRLSIPQSQQNTSFMPGWATSSPDPLSMNVFQQDISTPGDDCARFENIHAGNADKLPFFKKPFQR